MELGWRYSDFSPRNTIALVTKTLRGENMPQSKMQFNEMIDALQIGHELEFKFGECYYSIHCNYPDSWFLTLIDQQFTVKADDLLVLLSSVDFGGKSLEEIWENVEIQVFF